MLLWQYLCKIHVDCRTAVLVHDPPNWVRQLSAPASSWCNFGMTPELRNRRSGWQMQLPLVAKMHC